MLQYIIHTYTILTYNLANVIQLNTGKTISIKVMVPEIFITQFILSHPPVRVLYVGPFWQLCSLFIVLCCRISKYEHTLLIFHFC